MLSAAFVNAASGNVFDFDDTHHPTIIHPTAPVAPALFALAESQPMSGAALLHAFVLGVEVECRLGNAVSPWHYRRGWHITSTCGVFGAAAAVAKVLALDAEHIVWALGNASAQSSGLVETLGTMAKSIGVGAAARGGLVGRAVRAGRRLRPGRADRRAARLPSRDGRRREPRRDHARAWARPGSCWRTRTSPIRAASCCFR